MYDIKSHLWCHTCYENTHFKSVWQGQLVHNNVCLEYRTLWEYSVYDILDKHYYAEVDLLIPIWNVYFRNMRTSAKIPCRWTIANIAYMFAALQQIHFVRQEITNYILCFLNITFSYMFDWHFYKKRARSRWQLVIPK